MDTIMSDREYMTLPARESFPLRIETALAKTMGWVGSKLIAVFDAVGEARQRSYERRLLAEMDRRTCVDIGLNPRDASVVKPDSSVHEFWRGGTGYL
jgi:uncharacterized protein YjiS (DUF1127 family)